MLTIEEARALIVDDIAPLSPTAVPLLQALGRVASEPVHAPHALPMFANSAMDGYAVQASDTHQAGESNPVCLPVVGIIPAAPGTPPALEPRTAMRIFTGAPMPEGADAVVMQENTRAEGNKVHILAAARAGQHVRRPGEDLSRGDPILHAEDLVTPGRIGVLAALGITSVHVRRQATVAIVPTGDELVEVGEMAGPGQIPSSNSLLLAAMVHESGAASEILPIARDSKSDLAKALKQAAAAADLVVTCGGVSVGDFDVVREVLQDTGRMDFWKVAIKPGKPLAYGRIQGTPLVGLPGNPVSAFVTFELFVRSAIRRLHGLSPTPRYTKAKLKDPIPPDGKRRELVRGISEWQGEELWVHPVSKRSSGQQSSLLGIDLLIDIPPGKDILPKGSTVDALALEAFFSTRFGWRQDASRSLSTTDVSS